MNRPASLADQVRLLLDGPRPLPIVAAGHPVLRRTAVPYDGELEPEVWSELLDAMRHTMLTAPGVGLAAPQIGLGIQVAVLQDDAAVTAEVAVARQRHRLPFRVLVNPDYRPVGDRLAAFYEGCLSVPGYQAVVARAAEVRLTGLDESGHGFDEIITGWAARIVAHETDHLRGILYLDRAELRSLADQEQYLHRWSSPSPDAAARELGFRTGS